MRNQLELKHANLLVFDKEGVGRGNLLTAAILKSELLAKHPNLSVTSVGLHKPQSGRTTIHEDVISVAHNRLGVDISGWPITLVRPDHVNARTISIGLCEPEYIPPFILEKSFEVLLHPITDPFGRDLRTKIETTVSQIAFIEWLLYVTLTRRFIDLGNSRDEKNLVIPRYLTQFEPKKIEEKYSFDGWSAEFNI